MSNFRGLSLADFERKQREIKAKVRTVHILPRDYTAENKTGRPKIAEGFRARGAQKKREQRARLKAVPFVPEAIVLRACIEVLDSHPLVAFWWRQNTGAGLLASGRYVKFSFRGASDLMGMLTDGTFLAVEVKGTGKRPSDEQAAFLANVALHNGCSICVDDAGKLVEWLNRIQMASQDAPDGA